MRDVIKLLKEHNEIIIIDKEVDVNLEIPHIAYVEVKKSNSKALLFTRPVDRAKNKVFDMPVLINLFGSFKRLNLLIGDVEKIAKDIEKYMHMSPPESLLSKIAMFGELFRLKNVFPKRSDKKGECQEVVLMGDMANLLDLPVLKTWDEDGGAFITMGQVYTTSIDGKVANLGLYRLQVYDKNHLGLHWQIHKDSNHFFHQYKKANKKMPVSIVIGSDPLYTYCATAPLPFGVNELMLYGFIKNKSAKVVKSLTNDIYIPADADIVIEGFVDTNELKIEGPFGDHTGYYTLKEPYPFLEVSAITKKERPIFLATVVGKPPLEDKYLGFATERIFLPLLKANTPDLIDYHMPENGVFHNFIMAKIAPLYPAHAKQIMHAFWGVGQMSFVKHAIFVGEDAPKLTDYDKISTYILNRISPDRLLITEGILDALDHSSNRQSEGGKLGVDCTGDEVEIGCEVLSDDELYQKVCSVSSDFTSLKQYKTDTKNPICIAKVDKKCSMKIKFEELSQLSSFLKIFIVVDESKNDLENVYMLLWRVVNNIDARRDIVISNGVIFIDATAKNEFDGFCREWPRDVECNKDVIKKLQNEGLLDIDEAFIDRFYL